MNVENKCQQEARQIMQELESVSLCSCEIKK